MGKVIMSGIVPQLEAPSTEILASNIAVGSTVYLMENGSPVEYLVVNQGIPSNSSLYDTSCNGIWLLRKDIYTTMVFDNYDNDYENSDIHAYLNSTFLNLFDSNTKSAIKQVKIPYMKGYGSSGTTTTGSSGLSTKIFLLGTYELGWTTSTNSNMIIDGACLSYFNGTSATDSKRIAKYNGTATTWWLRSPLTSGKYNSFATHSKGSITYPSFGNVNGIRPTLILPSTAVFDETTLTFKGVK